MAKEYSGAGRLPLIIPTDWSVDRVLHFINGGKHQPAFVATITRKTVRRNTMAEWGLVA